MITPQHLEEMHQVAEKAADRALEKFFLKLGVDASEEAAVLAMQKDFAHLRAWRESVDLVKRSGLRAAATIVVTGLMGAIYAFFWHGRV